jgi:hypothetical protein
MKKNIFDYIIQTALIMTLNERGGKEKTVLY